jgi:hypothetical protein
MGRIGTRSAWATLVGGVIAATGVGTAVGATVSGSQTTTLNASRHVAGSPAVTYGQSIKLSGHENHAGLRTVVLQADPFPFTTGFHNVARVRTHGAYAFTVKPSRASQYRVLVTGVPRPTSHVMTVYVLVRTVSSHCNLCSLANSAGLHVLVVRAKLQPTSGIGPIYFYYGQANGTTLAPSTLPLVKAVSPQVTSAGMSFSVSYRVRFPSGPSRFRYSFCRTDDEAHDGYGLPGHHHCGAATVTASEYLG